MRTRISTACLVATLIVLQGCTEVASTGVQVVYNRHNIEKNIRDQYITMQAFRALNLQSKEFNNANIAIATFNGEVLLAGQAPYAWQKAKAGHIVKAIPHVQQVYNLVRIASPSSTLKRVSDAWLTTKVKTKLIASDELDASQVKVVTENGTVYLMGTLRPLEALAAAELTRDTEGVERVIKLFSYINITKRPVM